MIRPVFSHHSPFITICVYLYKTAHSTILSFNDFCKTNSSLYIMFSKLNVAIKGYNNEISKALAHILLLNCLPYSKLLSYRFVCSDLFRLCDSQPCMYSDLPQHSHTLVIEITKWPDTTYCRLTVVSLSYTRSQFSSDHLLQMKIYNNL